jgi:hypothetical protein
VTDRENDLRRAAAAVKRSIAMGSDDDEHPAYEQLEALVDSRLDAADREWLQGHLDACPICSEDVADLTGMRDAMRAAPERNTAARGWKTYLVAAASVAAALAMAVWFNNGQGPVSSAPSNTVATALPPSASAPVTPTSSLTPAEQAIVARTIEAGRLNLPAPVAELAGSVGTLLGTSNDAATVSPIGPAGTATLSARPRFSWHPVTGATGYVITIYDEGFNEIARSPRMNSTEWTPANDLPSGHTLAWQITAELSTGSVTGPAPPQPEAKFRVIDSKAREVITAQMTRLANEPLALGILLANAGLLDEALPVLERAAADAATRQQAQALLKQLRRP